MKKATKSKVYLTPPRSRLNRYIDDEIERLERVKKIFGMGDKATVNNLKEQIKYLSKVREYANQAR